jgi:hypothetical protein
MRTVTWKKLPLKDRSLNVSRYLCQYFEIRANDVSGEINRGGGQPRFRPLALEREPWVSDPDQNPHYFWKLVPDPESDPQISQHSGVLEAQNEAVEGRGRLQMGAWRLIKSPGPGRSVEQCPSFASL